MKKNMRKTKRNIRRKGGDAYFQNGPEPIMMSTEIIEKLNNYKNNNLQELNLSKNVVRTHLNTPNFIRGSDVYNARSCINICKQKALPQKATTTSKGKTNTIINVSGIQPIKINTRKINIKKLNNQKTISLNNARRTTNNARITSRLIPSFFTKRNKTLKRGNVGKRRLTI